jgi:SAM-dependent methyltransferase
MDDGWDQSAQAWIADMGEHGDFARRFVLDRPMTALATARPRTTALDVGCGEGRFCRVLRDAGIEAVGIDPTEALLERARKLDPGGDYRIGRAEALEFADGEFDLVVSYLSLIDIPDAVAAIIEMSRVLAPGGSLLIANLNAFNTAAMGHGWVKDPDGRRLHYAFDRYLEERAGWLEYRGIRILNRHRPLGRYMGLLLAQGLILRRFDEPEPHGGDPATVDGYRRAPWFVVMEWEKPPRPTPSA